MGLIRRHSAFKRAGGSTLLNGLLAYWNFDEASGNLINQLGDANFDGTLVGGVTQNQAGKVGTSYLFNGTTGYINLPNETLDLSTTDFTIDCWLKIPDLSGSKFILDKRDASTDGFLFAVLNNVIFVKINAVDNLSGALSINTWYHVLFTADRDGNGTIYINNSAQTPISIAASGNINVTTKAKIGVRSFSTLTAFYKDNLDEMAIYNRVLTTAEIALRYNLGNGNTYPFN